MVEFRGAEARRHSASQSAETAMKFICAKTHALL